MAAKRMFSKEITEDDRFYDLPFSTQALYMHLNMNADDDGFVKDARKITRSMGCQMGDLELLEAKRLIIGFPTGIKVITHWHINNSLRNDRHTETLYQIEKVQLVMLETKELVLKDELENYVVSDKDVFGVPIISAVAFKQLPKVKKVIEIEM